jgi:hypothetical protein
MSDEYLDILSAELTVTALANRDDILDDDVVERSLTAWASGIDQGLPSEVPDYGLFIVDDGRRYRMRAAALVVACVLVVTSTGVAVAVGAHPFNPIVRLLKQILAPDSVHPLGGRGIPLGAAGQAPEVRSVVGARARGARTARGSSTGRTQSGRRGADHAAHQGGVTKQGDGYVPWPTTWPSYSWGSPSTIAPTIFQWIYPSWGIVWTKTARPVTSTAPTLWPPRTLPPITLTPSTGPPPTGTSDPSDPTLTPTESTLTPDDKSTETPSTETPSTDTPSP